MVGGLLLLARAVGLLLTLSGIALIAVALRHPQMQPALVPLFSGLALLLGGVPLLLRRAEAVLFYSLLILLAGLWALIEPGIDGWHLLPGLVLWLALGVMLLPVNHLLAQITENKP
ncbi:hypothetical protein [Pseudomonas sp. Gutcm_11s]|uniref:hypothetical protein n=1 Tax=Pseudomonas sp. Gutcm_11s TaxID=3026088 RepID=UPI002361E657|nr:hypothetical protein [Pseudomonas sp. Gutcm_11s]MDD0843565.1 hypothetical protein [Pseudomonas sp. Gutcm_11s]